MKVFLLELHNYREWTELLGEDREWKIQGVQHFLSYKLMDRVSQLGGVLLPLRYDLFLILADGIGNRDLTSLFRYAVRLSPVMVKGCLGHGMNPVEAQVEANECLQVTEPGKLGLGNYEDSPVAVVHYDLNGFRDLTARTSMYHAFVEVQKLFLDVTLRTYKLGGITQYLGGDNIVTFLSPEDVDGALNVVSRESNVKAGVGIGFTPREALRNATRALTEIRRERKELWKIVSGQ